MSDLIPKLARRDESVRFGWCFSHGRLHHNPARCTAFWVPLAAEDEGAALVEKRRQFGDARFLDELTPEHQFQVLGR
ncbi:hypothetical protein [Nocardia sp. NRRL S-836]|uniref:hypothetical protein n=1 Tax=Nocardia sp. NRRL S-836 TaxID=1519492 RepID=UPI0012F8DA2C|nr:hypothetical protein [Nocardia sp. NRRL S-836]